MIRRCGVLLSVFVLLVTLPVGNAVAQTVAMDPTPPSRAQVLALLTAMGIRQNVESSLHKAQENVKSSARAALKKKHPEATAEDVKKLDAVFDSTPLFGFEEISETLIGVYQKNLSAADVQAGIDFYTSEAGQRLVGKLPTIIHEANESSQETVRQKLELFADTIQRKLTAFETEYEKQHPLNKPAPPAAPSAENKEKPAAPKSK